MIIKYKPGCSHHKPFRTLLKLRDDNKGQFPPGLVVLKNRTAYVQKAVDPNKRQWNPCVHCSFKRGHYCDQIPCAQDHYWYEIEDGLYRDFITAMEAADGEKKET